MKLRVLVGDACHGSFGWFPLFRLGQRGPQFQSPAALQSPAAAAKQIPPVARTPWRQRGRSKWRMLRLFAIVILSHPPKRYGPGSDVEPWPMSQAQLYAAMHSLILRPQAHWCCRFRGYRMTPDQNPSSLPITAGPLLLGAEARWPTAIPGSAQHNLLVRVRSTFVAATIPRTDEAKCHHPQRAASRKLLPRGTVADMVAATPATHTSHHKPPGQPGNFLVAFSRRREPRSCERPARSPRDVP